MALGIYHLFSYDRTTNQNGASFPGRATELEPSLPGARYFLIIDNVRIGDLFNGLASLLRLDCPVGEVSSF